MLSDKVREEIFKAYQKCGFGDAIASVEDVLIETPRDKLHGDYATNMALTLAKPLGQNPRDIAARIVDAIEKGAFIESAEIAGPGFVNVRLSVAELAKVIPAAIEADATWGRNNSGRGEKVQIEFVSANPTGPLSVGHGRLAVFGDALASVLDACGFEVQREYYVNDIGNQVMNLAMSVDKRYHEALGKDAKLGEIGYQGEYIKDYAKELIEKFDDSLLEKSDDERRKEMAEFTICRVLEDQQKALGEFGIKFDRWFREHELYDADLVEQTLAELDKKGCVYEKEGAMWFASSKYFDTQDRVLKKSEGIPTYFLSDIAYHKNKYERGFKTVIDIWGADHHGYIPRMKSSMQALDLDPGKLEILIVQLVRFKQSGFLVRMSKRKGNLVELSDLAKEVGVDVTRFFFLMRTKESHLDFDLELAKDNSEANPMFYLQYAHARICSLIAKGVDMGLAPDAAKCAGLLGSAQERLLMKRVADFPWEVQAAGAAREPHRIITYMTELAGDFHNFYHDHRVVDEANADLSAARLALCEAVRSVFRGGLSLIGVSAPVKM